MSIMIEALGIPSVICVSDILNCEDFRKYDKTNEPGINRTMIGKNFFAASVSERKAQKVTSQERSFGIWAFCRVKSQDLRAGMTR
jgi:hypothetical protein